MGERGLAGIYNYRPLSERIATSGQPTEDQLAAIAAAGYQVVVNLALHEGEYALPDEGAIIEALGMQYVHIPVQWERPTPGDLKRFFGVMETHGGDKVWVHCAANMRVSIFMALYRVLTLGWALDEALVDVHALWTPNEIWQRFLDDALRAGERST
jgi:uncharacterized protein (TIGR01244 family)